MGVKAIVVTSLLGLLALAGVVWLMWPSQVAEAEVVVQTELVEITTYQGRCWCVANGRQSPGTFQVLATNYSEDPLSPAVTVDGDWITCEPDPVIPPARTAPIRFRVDVPQDAPKGRYTVDVHVGGALVPVYIDVGVERTTPARWPQR